MKKLNLRTKFIITFSLIFLLIFGIISVGLPKMIDHSFTKKVYSILVENYNPLKFKSKISKGGEVQHLVIDIDNIKGKNLVAVKVYRDIVESITFDFKEGKLYKYSNDNQMLYYTIIKGPFKATFGENIYHVLYMDTSYMYDVISIAYRSISIALVVSFLIGTILIVYFTNGLTKPILKLEKHVQRIASNNFDEEIVINQDDEIGSLARNIDKMRRALIEQEQNEKEMIQNISHDLKTPIMVINSYATSIKDNFYSQEENEEIIDVILNESKRLEAKVNSLIYLNKLNIEDKTEQVNIINLNEVINEMIEKYEKINKDFVWNIKSGNFKLKGELKDWEVVFENIFDNYLRYANKFITIIIEDDKVVFRNDGEHIDLNLIEQIFVPYKKGYKGNFGLGLSIVYRTVKKYGYNIMFENVEGGVELIIYL